MYLIFVISNSVCSFFGNNALMKLSEFESDIINTNGHFPFALYCLKKTKQLISNLAPKFKNLMAYNYVFWIM